MKAVARGDKLKQVAVDEDSVVKVDTFKGFVHPDEIHLGPDNMPSSEDGRGLIRNKKGALVYK
jgi:hypothetical protein